MPDDPARRAPTLADQLLAAYLAALVYGTLYPWTGWRSLGLPGFAFLLEPWPRYWTWFDLLANVVVYLPLGALAMAALRHRLPATAAAVLAAVAACLLSLGLEALQAFLPGRVPSRLDWLANSAGAAAGAGLARLAGPRLARHGAPGARRSLDPEGALVGLALIGGWLLIQMQPQRLLFGSGDVVDALLGEAGAALRLDSDYTVFAEAIGTASAVLAVGLMVREIFPASRARDVLTGAVIALAALIRSVSASLLLGPGHAFAWLSAGAQGGLVVGVVALALFASGRRRARLRAAIAALALTAVLTSLFPVDAYYATTVQRWDLGAWRNVGALLQAVAALWPFAAGLWCLSCLRRLPPAEPIMDRDA